MLVHGVFRNKMADDIVPAQKRKYISVEDIDSTLECQVCMELPIKPIFQCKNGHIYCKTCSPKLKNCPSCKVKLNKRDPIRSLVGEKLLDMEYPLAIDEKRQKSVNPIQLSLQNINPECDNGNNSKVATAKESETANSIEITKTGIEERKEKAILEDMMPETKKDQKPEDVRGSQECKERSNLEGNKVWKCQNCTILNEDHTNICQMCSKSRLIPESLNATNLPRITESLRTNEWNCHFCTYLNEESIRICKMCAKSRLVLQSPKSILNLSRNDETRQTESTSGVVYSLQRISGPDIRNFSLNGIECTRCTFINTQSSQMCHACGGALHTKTSM